MAPGVRGAAEVSRAVPRGVGAVALIRLASQSSRRAALLRQIGIPFEICPADVDERPMRAEPASVYVERLALAKARHVATAGRVTLGADTAVVLDGEIFGKPVDMEQGISMLLELAGRTHQVVTGVAVTDGQRHTVAHVISHVTFRAVAAAEALAYWGTGEPRDKSGGSGIQGIGSIFAQSITGSYSAVVGLPLSETEQMLQGFGVDTWRARSDG